MKKLLLIFLLFISLYGNPLPKGFVYLTDICPTVEVELKYFSEDNFVGKKVDGYHSNNCIVSHKAALAVQKVQEELLKHGLSLKIFDAYRPQSAVDHFVRWSRDENDTITKKMFYPSLQKSVLFKQGYIAYKSGHSRGSTIDVTIIDSATKEEIDMGAIFDLFDTKSHVTCPDLTKEQRANRLLLQTIMIKHGFKPYRKEWWHFRLKNEPFPSTYFNFPVK